LGGLRASSARLVPPPRGGSDDDPRTVSADALGHLEKNQCRLDHPGYRRLDVPICIAAVESLITSMNHRMNGMEQFGKDGRAGAAYVSEEGWGSFVGLGCGRTHGPMEPVAFACDLHLQERDCTLAMIGPFFRAAGASMIVTILNHNPASRFGPATFPEPKAPDLSDGNPNTTARGRHE
jgi:hypothetical protein